MDTNEQFETEAKVRLLWNQILQVCDASKIEHHLQISAVGNTLAGMVLQCGVPFEEFEIMLEALKTQFKDVFEKRKAEILSKKSKLL